MLPGALDQELTPIGAERDASRPRADDDDPLAAPIQEPRSPSSAFRKAKTPTSSSGALPSPGQTVVASAQPFLDFYIDAALSEIDLSDAPAKSAAVRRLVPLLEAAGDQVVQAHYAGIIARKLQLPESSVLLELRRSAVRTSAPRSARAAPPMAATTRHANENHLLALLLRHRAYCQNILPLVPMEDLADARNRELLRVLQDPAIPYEMAPEMIVAGLDDLVADHAEALLERLEQTPPQFPGQIDRDARRALIRLEKERFDYLMSQLQSSIAAAEEADDLEALSDLRHQLSALYERHRQFYPPRSPYFRDTRDGERSQAASGR